MRQKRGLTVLALTNSYVARGSVCVVSVSYLTGGGHGFLRGSDGNVKCFSATNDITYKNMTHRPAVFSNEEVRISKAGGGISIMEAPHGANRWR